MCRIRARRLAFGAVPFCQVQIYSSWSVAAPPGHGHYIVRSVLPVRAVWGRLSLPPAQDKSLVLIRGGEGRKHRLIQFSCQFFFLLSFWEAHFYDLSFHKCQRSIPCFWQFHSLFHSCNCLLSSCRQSACLFQPFFFSPSSYFRFFIRQQLFSCCRSWLYQMISVAIKIFFSSLFSIIFNYNGLREAPAPWDGGGARFYSAVSSSLTKLRDLVQLMWLVIITLVNSFWIDDGFYLEAGTT